MSSADHALFDAPGPSARGRIRRFAALSTVVLAAVVYLAYRRLAERGQFEPAKWTIFTDPGTAQFLLGGVGATLTAGLIVITISLPLSVLIALARLSSRRWLSSPARIFVDFFRAMPLLLLILFFAVGFPALGWQVSALWVLVMGMCLYYLAVFSEVVRAGILSLPRGQREAALALGMTERHSLRLVELPQALVAMSPAILSQVLFLVQDTSLGYVIPYEELLRRGQEIASFSPASLLPSYAVVAAIYGVISLLLLLLTRLVEARVTRRASSTVPRPPEDAVLEQTHM